MGSPNGVSLLAVNEEGEIHLISLISRSVLHRLRTNREISCIKISPDSKHFALTKEFNAFAMERVLKGAYDFTTCLDWSSCSRILAVGSRDMTVRIYALTSFSNLSVCCLGGSSDPVVGAFFESKNLDIYSVARGGQLQVWESSLELEDLKPV